MSSQSHIRNQPKFYRFCKLLHLQRDLRLACYVVWFW
jgi:hypothetical protein